MELYELLNNNKISKDKWVSHVAFLKKEVIHYNTKIKDSIRKHPYMPPLKYKGIIPLQAEFFLATLDKNVTLKEKYKEEYNMLKETTSTLLGLGYKESEFLKYYYQPKAEYEYSAFWFFFQLEGCKFGELLINNDIISEQRLGTYARALDMQSTFKVPLELQVRKRQSLSRSTKLCRGKYIDIAKNIAKSEIGIEDKNRNFFKDRDGTGDSMNYYDKVDW